MKTFSSNGIKSIAISNDLVSLLIKSEDYVKLNIEFEINS